MQHLDRRLEHLDEFHQTLIGPAERARVAVGIGVVLGKPLQLADIDLADQRGDVLIVLVARFGLGDGDLLQDRGVELDDLELGDIAVVLLQPLHRPGRHDGPQIARRDPVVLFEDGTVLLRREKTQRRLEHRRAVDGVERPLLHQLLELLGQRGLAAADRPEQVENLLLLLQPLRGVLEIGDQMLDRLLHAIELGEGRIAPQHFVLKDAAQARIVAGVDHLGLADRHQQALRGTRIGARIRLTELQILIQAQHLLARGFIACLITFENRHSRYLTRKRMVLPRPRRRRRRSPTHQNARGAEGKRQAVRMFSKDHATTTVGFWRNVAINDRAVAAGVRRSRGQN